MIDMFIDTIVMIEIVIDNHIQNKETFDDSFKEVIQEQIEYMGAIYATLDEETLLKYELGVMIRDLTLQQDRVLKYELSRARKSQSHLAMLDAFAYPEIAELIVYTKNGLKTRNKFYERV